MTFSLTPGQAHIPVQNGVFTSHQQPARGTSGRPHNGIDLNVPEGTPVYAVAAGTVFKIYNSCPSAAQRRAFTQRELQRRGGACICGDSSGRLGSYGNYVAIEHEPYVSASSPGFYTVYMHLDEIFVTEGQQVTAGTLLANSGKTTAMEWHGERDRCNSMVPHLHFEITKKWPTDADATSDRYDAIHELGKGGIVTSGSTVIEGNTYPLVAQTGTASTVYESRVTGAPYNAYYPEGTPSETTAKRLKARGPAGSGDVTAPATMSKWPIFVGIGGVVIAAGLITWAIVRPRRAAPTKARPGAGVNRFGSVRSGHARERGGGE